MENEHGILLLAVWAVTGIFWVIKSPSRGVVADILFGLLWPVYWYVDWKQGRWVATTRGTAELLFPAAVVVVVAIIASL